MYKFKSQIYFKTKLDLFRVLKVGTQTFGFIMAPWYVQKVAHSWSNHINISEKWIILEKLKTLKKYTDEILRYKL